MRRVVVIVTGAVAALVLVAVLTFMVLLATAPGHNALRRYGLDALNDAIAGSATVGRVGGSLWRGAEVTDLDLRDTAGTSVIRVASVRVGYGLRDLLRKRLIFRDIELVRPVVLLEQQQDGSWNVQQLFRLQDTTESAPRERMLVDLRGVRITDGTLIVRRRFSRDSLRTSRFYGINTHLRRLRLSHPDSSALEAVIAAFAARWADPAVAITDMAGTAALDGDSARFDLATLNIGQGTRLATRGRVRWGERTAGEINVDAPQVVFSDLRGLVPELPAEGSGSVRGQVVLLPGGGIAINIERTRLVSGRSRVGGSGRLAIGRGGGVTVTAADVTLDPLDLRLLEPYVDTLPVRGLVTGRATGRGAANDLAITVAVAFRDAAAPAAPPSNVTLAGRVRLGGPEGLVAHGVALRRVDVQLASMQAFASSLPGRGRVTVTGVLNGPYRDLRLDSATITLADGTTPSTVLKGSVATSIHSAPRLFATLSIDTMSFEQLKRFLPGVPLTGRASGALGVSGPLDSLDFNVSLHGAWGAAQARGLLSLTDSLVRVDAAGTVDSFDVSRHVAGAPPTRLAGRWSARFDAPGGDAARAAPSGTVRLVLDSVRVAGVQFAGAGASLAIDAERYVVDSLWLVREDFSALAVGAIGREGAGPRQLTFSVRADTLERLAPLARWVRAELQGDTAGRDTLGVPRGGARLSGRLIGTTAKLDVDATLEAPLLRLDSNGVRGLNLVVVASPQADRPRFDVLLRADSAWAGGLGYGDLDVRAAGTADSFAGRAAATFGDASELAAAVRVKRDSTHLHASVDGLRLVLPTRTWELRRPFEIVMDPDSITVDTFDLRATSGAGRIYAVGTLPRRRPGDFSLTADSVSLPGIYALIGRDTSGIGGWVGMNLRITGPAASPTMNLVAVIEDGRFEDYRVPLFQVAGRYEDRRVTFKGGLWRDTLRVLNIGASLPLDLSLSGVTRRRLEGAWVVQAQADSVDLALLNQITDVVRDPSGRLTADVEASGRWGEPARLSGTVQLDDGAFTIPVINERYTSVDARFRLADSVITVERARAASGGTLDLDGRIVLRSGRGVLPWLDLRMDARRFNAINMREFAGVTATGQLTLRGPTLGATLRGRATIDVGYLMFADLVEKRIVNLDDPEFRAIVDSSLAVSRELAPSAFSVFMDSLRIADLTVGMGNSVWLRSTEANIQLTGEFRVSKSVEDGLPRYRMDGTLNASRGTYRLNLAEVASKDFRVTRGTVRFFGSPDFNPELDIIAEHVVRKVDGGQLAVRAVITGTIQSPQLRLESDQQPPLSETEIVSYLMFGRPTFELESGPGATNERGLVATAMTSMAGTVSAGILQQSLVSELGLPIDYLTIRPGAATSESALLSGARIEAGKQISSRTFLTLNAGLCEVSQGELTKLLGATLEYRLSRRWTLETSYEPVVTECRTDPAARNNLRFQFGFDLFWQSGIR